MSVILLKDARTILGKQAYDWAVKEQKRLGCMAEPIQLDFKSDFLTEDRFNCIVSVFCDQEKVIMRRDWLDDMGIKYNILTNYEEIKRVAPLSAAHMLNNGIKLYRYYDGPTGGVTRHLKKEWI